MAAAICHGALFLRMRGWRQVIATEENAPALKDTSPDGEDSK
jgi:hypothetical protein